MDLPAECFDRNADTCVISRVCRLRGALEEAVHAFYRALDRYTLADIASNRTQLVKLLRVA